MKQIFIQDLKKGDTIFGEPFAIKYYRKSSTRNNKPFIDLELADKTGTIRGKIWADDMASCAESKEGDVVSINGTVEEFQNRLQVRMTNLSVVTKFDLEDYQTKSKNDTEKMFKEIEEAIISTKNPHLKLLLEDIFKDKKFEKSFKEASAAYTVHHSYVGGLLEHTLEVLCLAKALVKKFPKLNTDLLTAGVILHDIGKVFEFQIGTTINLSKEGRLLGHIFLGADYVKDQVQKEMPKDLFSELLHLILSHHGEMEFGSPVRPMTAEAVALWACDSASAKVNMAYNTIHEGKYTEEFTEYHRQLGTELYRSPYLETLINEDIPF